MIEKDILLMWKGLSRPDIRNSSKRGKNAEDQARCIRLNGLYLLNSSMSGIRRACSIPVFGLLKFGLQDLGSINRRMEEFCSDTFLHLLNPGVIEIQDTVFIGCTLWTDFCLYGDQPANMALSERCLNDYRLIRIADEDAERILTPEDTLTIHNQHRLFLETQLEAYQGRRVVVIT